jgi:hypothetical protein
MTVFQLQKDLMEEIESVLSDIMLKKPKGGMGTIKSYSHELPKREQVVKPGSLMPEDDGDDPYPFCVVRMESGSIYPGKQGIRTVLVFGIFDDALENQGHQALLNVIHRVAERFVMDPVLKNRYQLNGKEGIGWILDDEERYPYYIGAMEMVWDTFFVEREDRYV